MSDLKNRLVDETLCWSCTRPGTRTCCWDDSKGTEPVPGWEATPTVLRLNHTATCRCYVVRSCPLYDPTPDYDRRSRRRGRPAIIPPAMLAAMFQTGYSDYRIAAYAGLSVSAVGARRKRWRHMQRLDRSTREETEL